MTDQFVNSESVSQDEDDTSLFAIATILVTWWRTVVAMGLLGAGLGLSMGLTSPRMYISTATFVPQGSEGGASGLTLAASQFGIRLPATSSGWGPLIYVELLNSRSFLQRVALDTIVVVEKGQRSMALMDFFEITAPTLPKRVDLTVQMLRRIVSIKADKTIGAVKLSVTTQWPSVSQSIADKLVRAVDKFNLETRKSQARAERRFVEEQAAEAERALRKAEDEMQSFLQRNRAISGSPELGFDRDRLQREVVLRQQVYTSLLQNREEARIREVRDTPVITVLEAPQIPTIGEPRNSVRKGVIGGLTGAVLSVLIVFLAQGLISAKRAPSADARAFFQILDEATPRFLRRKGARVSSSP